MALLKGRFIDPSEAIKLSSDPTAGEDVARKVYVDTKAQEAASAAQGAAEAYVNQKFSELVNASPETLDTLKELADALGQDPNFAATVAGQIGSLDDKIDQEVADRILAVSTEASQRQAADSAEASARQTADALLDGKIALKQNSLGTGTTSQYLRGDLTWQEIVTSAPVTQIKYVSKNGVDASADGSEEKPYLTIAAAMAAITDASPSKRYVIRIAAGNYTEASVAIKSNIFLVGDSKESVRITGAVSMGAWTQDNSGSDDRSGFSMVSLLSAVDLNWNTAKSRAGKIYMNEVVFSSTLSMTGYDNGIAQAQFDSCLLFGNMTVSGINVGVFTNNTSYANITLNQHASLVSTLVATGGTCSGTVRFNTTVSNFNRRSAGFLKAFNCENLIIDGPSSYADVDLVSQGKSSTQKLNGGNLVALNPRISHDLETQMLKPLSNNAHNSGDWGKQWMYNFAWVHATAGQDMYLTSVMEDYWASPNGDSAGRSIFIQSDGYGLQTNVNGGNIELETAGVSGTGIRGKVVVKARELDMTSAKITSLAAGSASSDAVNKGQLDAGVTEAKSYADQKVADLINGAPALLDTLKELADAVQADQTGLAALVTQVGTIQSGLAQEIVDRAAADSTLQSNITAEETRALAAEAALQGEVDAVEAGLAQEILDRQAADDQRVSKAGDTMTGPLMVESEGFRAILQSNALIASQLDGEGNPIASAVVSCGGITLTDALGNTAVASSFISLFDAEGLPAVPTQDENVATKKYVDQSIQGAVSAEQAARETADQVLSSGLTALDQGLGGLSGRVSALEARPEIQGQKVAIDLTAQDVANGYVEMSHEPMANTMLVVVSGIVHSEGEDYTLSTSSGVTRISFIGDLAAKLQEGDKVRVQFLKQTN